MTVWVVTWWDGIQGVYATRDIAKREIRAMDMGEVIMDDLKMWLREYEVIGD